MNTHIPSCGPHTGAPGFVGSGVLVLCLENVPRFHSSEIIRKRPVEEKLRVRLWIPRL